MTNAFKELIWRTPHRALIHTHTHMHALTQTDRRTHAYSGKQVTTVAPNVNENNTGTLTPSIISVSNDKSESDPPSLLFQPIMYPTYLDRVRRKSNLAATLNDNECSYMCMCVCVRVRERVTNVSVFSLCCCLSCVINVRFAFYITHTLTYWETNSPLLT